MRIVFIIASMFVWGCTPANAADIAKSMKDIETRDRPFLATEEAPQNWNGVYVGGQIGYGHTVLSDDDGRGGVDLSGIFGGIRAGGDVQRGALVLGVWGEYNFSGQELSIYSTTLVEQTSDWSANARIGLASGSTLFYGFGGYGQAYFESFGAEYDAPLWRLGAGVEHKFKGGLSLGMEYAHNFIDVDELLSEGAEDVLDLDEDRVMLVARYRFGSPNLGIFSGN